MSVYSMSDFLVSLFWSTGGSVVFSGDERDFINYVNLHNFGDERYPMFNGTNHAAQMETQECTVTLIKAVKTPQEWSSFKDLIGWRDEIFKWSVF